MFVTCKVPKWLWTAIYLKLGKQWSQESKIQELIEDFSKDFKGKRLCATIVKTALCLGIYNLWKARNEVVFNEKQVNRMQILKGIELDVRSNLKTRELKDKDNSVNKLMASY